MPTETDILKRRLQREIAARKQAETILEQKALELYSSNEQLQRLNLTLEHTINERTKELADSKRQFQSLVESAGDIIYNANVQGYFTYVNPITTRILGYNTEELIGKHYTDLIRHDKVDEVRNFYRNVVENRIAASYLEFPVYAKNGRLFWLGQQVQVNFDDPMKIEITAIARDITELVNARKALEDSEKKYRSLINNMELGLMEVNKGGLVTKAYDWFCDMTGYTADELIGKDPIKIFVKPEDVHIIMEQDKNRLRGQAGIYELQLRKKSGEYIWVAISGVPFYDSSGNVAGSLGIHLDITAHKKLQKDLEEATQTALQAQQAEKDFLANMSHEIRTPLNAILGMANLLTTTMLDELQEGYVEDIKYAADVLHGMISDVLDISKIEAGEIDVVESDIDLRQTISMICKTLDFRVKEGGNTLAYTISGDVPQHVLADKNFINQILYNLVFNAIKFTKNGSITINVYLQAKYDNGELLLKFEIKDTGIGIKKDMLKHIFSRYKQETKDTDRKYGGTGLGLAISHKLVELHGGTVKVESEEGKGATFTFTLRVRQQATMGNDTPDVGKEHTLNNLKVLLAEDNELNLKYIQTILKQWGVDFSIARDGGEAVAMSEKKVFDIILMDMQMPVMDGYQATLKIRNNTNNPNNQSKILALTASALLDEKRKAREAGMDDQLTKPFTPNALYSFIARHIITPSQKQPTSTGLFEKLDLPGIINKQTLEEFYNDDKEYARQMVDIYLNIIYAELENGKLYLQVNDYKGMLTWIHKLSSNFMMVGLHTVTEQFRHLEVKLKETGSISGHAGDIDQLLNFVADANIAVEKLKEALEK